MRRLLLLFCCLLIAGCSGRPAPVPQPAPASQPAPAPQPAPASQPAQAPQPTPAPPAPPPPSVEAAPPAPATSPWLGDLLMPYTRDQVRDELVWLMNNAGGTPQEKLNAQMKRDYPNGEVPWLEADLDGNGDNEFILVTRVQDDKLSPAGHGAALFVIYRQDGHWAVDRTDPLDRRVEAGLMGPHLHAAADLVGSGHPQIIWSRPEAIATGPQPNFVFVTAWKPGAFTQIPGLIVLSNDQMKLDGRDLVLTGTTRNNTYLPVMQRTDRYRYVDGAFRLVDRQFNQHPADGYSRFWDGLVAEDSHRLADAETAYRQAMDPAMPAHSGQIFGYHMLPRELSVAEQSRFGGALRAFARFRLGILLLQAGRRDEATAVLQPNGGVYQGLFEGISRGFSAAATDREAACSAAQRWASATPEFLAALNIGVGTSPWTPELICSHIDIEDHGFWED